MRQRLPPRRSSALKLHVRELNKQPVNRYVDIQRERGHLTTIGKVDCDLEQLVARTFLCDRHRCIQWTPHEKKSQARALIDNSCCSRYSVPVTDLDRRKLTEILPLVKKRLAKSHPLVRDAEQPPFQIDEEDFSFVMNEFESGACQFVLYEAGLTTCAIHKTCLEEGLDVWEYKPLGCSLWPLALVDYEGVPGRSDHERYFLTIYASATKNLFESGDDDANEDSNFACLVDQDPAYEPLYRSCEGILTYTLGADFYQKLDRAARAYLKE
jgi:Protein of unknown function (DUF3109)